MFQTATLESSVLGTSDGLEEQLHGIVAHGTDLVVRLDLGGVIGFVSPIGRFFLDGDRADLVGTRFVDLMHIEDRSDRLFDELVAGRALSRRDVFRCRRTGDTFVWVEADFRLIADPLANTATGIVGVLRDITERRSAEDRLRESEERFRGSFAAAAHGMALVSTAGRWLDVNKAVCEIVGYTETELLETDFQTITHPEDLDKDMEYLDALIAGTIQNYQMEKRYFHKAGNIVWVLLSVSLVRDADGRPVHFVSQILDITAAREAERALREAKEEAERTNSLKTAFLATMSHEIRTPMNGVLGFADILLRTELTADQRRALTLLRDAGNSLLAIINDILDLSKIEAGKLRLEAIPTNLVDLVEGAVSIVRSQAAGKALDLCVEIDAGLPTWIEADPVRLRQVLLNLLSNAIKFTDRGSVTLRVRNATAQPHVLHFEVEDTGIGIPSENAGMLFKEFTQLDRSITRRYGGTGLGLAICKRLIEAMPCGRVCVDSEVGRGSRFWFTAALPTMAPDALSAGPVPAHRGAPHSARILVAEDNYINQVVVEQMLADTGYEVVIACDGQAAVEAVRAGVFDLVLMDMEMPVMDGISATRVIRAMPEPSASLPIVALTANAMREEAERCLAAGMNDHLSKPVDRETLVRTIAKWARPSKEAPDEEAPGTDGGVEVVDAAVVTELESCIGPDKFIDLLRKFRDQLARAGAVIAGSDVQAIGREAHMLISTAGVLGFQELMTRSRDLMTALNRRTDDVRPLVAAVRAAAGRAGEVIDDKCGRAAV